MTWETTYVQALRILINDLDAPEEFTDERLEETLALAGIQVMQAADFPTDYTIVISPASITPDPESDEAFLNLVTLKAACIIDRGSLRLAAAVNGIKAKCGPAQLEVMRRMDGFGILLDKGYCEAYTEALNQYTYGNVSFAKGILSPFINSNFDPSDYTSHDYHRLHK